MEDYGIQSDLIRILSPLTKYYMTCTLRRMDNNDQTICNYITTCLQFVTEYDFRKSSGGVSWATRLKRILNQPKASEFQPQHLACLNGGVLPSIFQMSCTASRVKQPITCGDQNFILKQNKLLPNSNILIY